MLWRTAGCEPVNEDIAQALLALEARTIQAEQRLADLEFQLRQAHRDLAKVQERVGVQEHNIGQIVGRHNDFVREVAKAPWLGRPRFPSTVTTSAELA